jgi:hypothetical protein
MREFAECFEEVQRPCAEFVCCQDPELVKLSYFANKLSIIFISSGISAVNVTDFKVLG